MLVGVFSGERHVFVRVCICVCVCVCHYQAFSPESPSLQCVQPLEHCSHPPTNDRKIEKCKCSYSYNVKMSRRICVCVCVWCTRCLRKALSAMQRSTVSGWWRTDTISKMSASLARTSTARAPWEHKHMDFFHPRALNTYRCMHCVIISHY